MLSDLKVEFTLQPDYEKSTSHAHLRALVTFHAQPAYEQNPNYAHVIPAVWTESNNLYYNTIHIRRHREQFEVHTTTVRVAFQHGPFVVFNSDPRWALAQFPTCYVCFTLNPNDLMLNDMLLVDTESTPVEDLPIGGYLWFWNNKRMWLVPETLTEGQIVQYYYQGLNGSFTLTKEQAETLNSLTRPELMQALDQLVLANAEGELK